MIHYATGNILTADVEALVNPVNCVGVAGKGLALEFKRAFPESFHSYAFACKTGKVKTGNVYAVKHSDICNPRWIIHFPTKQHWRDPSKIEWIRDGLVSLRNAIEAHDIQSIALPALGCGLGGLCFTDVKAEIEVALAIRSVLVTVYKPRETER